MFQFGPLRWELQFATSPPPFSLKRSLFFPRARFSRRREGQIIPTERKPHRAVIWPGVRCCACDRASGQHPSSLVETFAGRARSTQPLSRSSPLQPPRASSRRTHTRALYVSLIMGLLLLLFVIGVVVDVTAQTYRTKTAFQIAAGNAAFFFRLTAPLFSAQCTDAAFCSLYEVTVFCSSCSCSIFASCFSQCCFGYNAIQFDCSEVEMYKNGGTLRRSLLQVCLRSQVIIGQ